MDPLRSGAVAVERSFCSRRNSDSTKATIATGTAYRNTLVIDSAYAWWTASCATAGSRVITRGSEVMASGWKPGGSGRPVRASASRSRSPLANRVPKMETPKEAPMERKKVAPAVATPRSW